MTAGALFIFSKTKIITNAEVKTKEEDIEGNKEVTKNIENKYDVKFTGATQDKSTNLYHMGARYYDSNTGRFIDHTKNTGYTPPAPGPEEGPSLLARGISIGVGFIPGVGDAKDFIDAISGEDIITGEKLSWVDRGLSLASAFIPFVNRAALKGTSELAQASMKYYDDIADVARRSGDELLGGACFVAGTKIVTEDEYKSIEDIKVGDKVLSQDVDTGEKGYKEVKNVFIKEVDTLVHLDIEETKIDTTENHRFWIVDKGWTEAGNLKEGEKVLLSSGKISIISKVSKEKLKEAVKVYNFEVSDWHTYFVSNIGVLVHNDCMAKFKGAAKTEQKVIQVTKDGVALPPGRTIPDNLVENPYRSGSYGKINPKTGKFEEELRIDPPTPKGKKGPDYSHYHIKDTDGHLSPKPGDKDPWLGK